MLKKYLIFIFLLLVVAGCIKPPPEQPPGFPKPYKIAGQWYQPIPDAKGFVQEGIASWYGQKFHGRKTANGETYNMYGTSAAHKTLPFGTIVRVHNLENNKKLDVRINDRGPFVKGRIIDLSYEAAVKLGIANKGTAPVKIAALNILKSDNLANHKKNEKPLEFEDGNFYIQVGAFQNRSNAESLKKSIPVKNKKILITTESHNEATYHKVKIIGIKTFTKALQYEKYLSRIGYKGIFIVTK